MSVSPIVRALIWDENPVHAPKSVYPLSINGAIADGLNKLGLGKIDANTAHIDDAEQGISESILQDTDVLFWWGHTRHQEVTDETVRRIVERVHEGMGFIALHSAHYSKVFQAVVEGHGHLKGGWREMHPPEREEIRVCAPWHPIAQGVEDFVLEHEEYYGAPFDVPPPLEIIFQSRFPFDGRTFPTGLTWTVGPGKTPGFTCGPGEGIGEGHGQGRVFYFRPGHETVPTYNHPVVQLVLANAAAWCAQK